MIMQVFMQNIMNISHIVSLFTFYLCSTKKLKCCTATLKFGICYCLEGLCFKIMNMYLLNINSRVFIDTCMKRLHWLLLFFKKSIMFEWNLSLILFSVPFSPKWTHFLRAMIIPFRHTCTLYIRSSPTPVHCTHTYTIHTLAHTIPHKDYESAASSQQWLIGAVVLPAGRWASLSLSLSLYYNASTGHRQPRMTQSR